MEAPFPAPPRSDFSVIVPNMRIFPPTPPAAAKSFFQILSTPFFFFFQVDVLSHQEVLNPLPHLRVLEKFLPPLLSQLLSVDSLLPHVFLARFFPTARPPFCDFFPSFPLSRCILRFSPSLNLFRSLHCPSPPTPLGDLYKIPLVFRLGSPPHV